MNSIQPSDVKPDMSISQPGSDKTKKAADLISPEKAGLKEVPSDNALSRSTTDLSPKEQPALSKARSDEQKKATEGIVKGRILGGHTVRVTKNGRLSTLSEKLLPHTKQE